MAAAAGAILLAFVTADGTTLTFPDFGYLATYLQQNGIRGATP